MHCVRVDVDVSFSGLMVERKQVVFMFRYPAKQLALPGSDSYSYDVCVAVVRNRHSNGTSHKRDWVDISVDNLSWPQIYQQFSCLNYPSAGIIFVCHMCT